MKQRVLPVAFYAEQGWRTRDDALALEEPLEIGLSGADGEATISVTMRTPGEDAELALGFLFSEGVIDAPADVVAVVQPGDGPNNRILVRLADHVPVSPERFSRHVLTSASCGICGRRQIDDLTAGTRQDPQGHATLDPRLIRRLPDRLRAAQKLFSETGGVHGVGLFDSDGTLILVREDIGRHNALDKLIGACFMEKRLPADDTVLLLSGRCGFELVQKAVRAGIPVIAAVGAPTELAVSLASRFGMTLIGFLKRDHFNVYCGRERLADP